MLAPKRVKFRKMFKGRTTGLATRGATVAFGHYGLQSQEPGWVTSRQIEAETARALQAIRSEVADLTVIATQKVTGKVLDAADHKRLIDEAIGELDFSALQQGSPN